MKSIIICGFLLLSSCAKYSTTITNREFQTDDLLIEKDSLPSEWELSSTIHEERCHSFDMMNCIEGVGIGYDTTNGDFDQIIFRFESELTAYSNYSRNVLSHVGASPNGDYWIDYTNNVNHKHEINNVNISCEEGDSNIGISCCYIDIDIQEYYSIIIFRPSGKDGIIAEILLIYEAAEKQLIKKLM